MDHIGEIIALLVSVSWTISSICADKATHRMGAMSTNVIRLVMATVFLAVILLFTIGRPYPAYADGQTWMWLALSAIVGYLFGDWCLFNCYMYIGARFGQLLMTLAPPFTALAGWIMLGESLSWTSAIAMAVTIAGIAISILSRGADKHVHLTLPAKGVLLGIGAGIGQGVGLVLSKIGLTHYASAIPAEAPPMMNAMLPFASTMIRAIVGALGFFLMMAAGRKLKQLHAATQDRTGMKYAAILTIFGPAIGVSLSIAAVRYTNAGIASTLMALSPVLILIPYAFIYKQKISAREILGVAVTMVGVALFFLL